MNKVEEVIVLIKSKKVVAFTGAGASLESGIPTFRGRGGLWEKYDPRVYATLPFVFFTFLKNPDKISEFLIEFYEVLLRAEPNSTHYALAEFEKKGLLLGVITQNIDNLHQLAGTKNISELHGNAYKFRCRLCNRKKIKTKEEIRRFIDRLKRVKFRRRELIREILFFMGRCPCGARFIPSVVFFGQALPEEELVKAYDLIDKAEVFLSIGTSGVVYPAAGFPFYAKSRGCFLIEVNPENSEISGLADIKISDSANNFFSKILEIFDNF